MVLEVRQNIDACMGCFIRAFVLLTVLDGVAIDERNAIVARCGNHVRVGRVFNLFATGLVGKVVRVGVVSFLFGILEGLVAIV